MVKQVQRREVSMQLGLVAQSGQLRGVGINIVLHGFGYNKRTDLIDCQGVTNRYTRQRRRIRKSMLPRKR